MDRRYSDILSVCAIAAVVALLYGQTLQVPFYLDDTRALVDNYALRDLPATLWRLFSQRGLTNLTFALNYRLSGWSLAPLHLANILLHAGCSLLVWLLLRRLFNGWLPPLLGALLFAAHPLQTQAVTYLVQRSTLLGTLLFLSAFLLYLRARDALAAGADWRSRVYLRRWLGAVLVGAFAVLAKENTATLPLLLYAFSRLYPLPAGQSRQGALFSCLPFCLVPLIVGAMTLLDVWQQGGEKMLYYPLASLQHNSPLHYLVTQLSVLWVYLRLLILPYGQALEHDFPVAGQLLTTQSVVALAAWLLVAWLVWRVRHSRPLLAFGCSWFFLGLAVESSIIPLDPLFEHRLYLALPGFVLVLLDGLPALLGTRWSRAILVSSLLAYAPLTLQRNALWQSPTLFFEDNLRVIPDSERASVSLSAFYLRDRRFPEARQLLDRALRLYPENSQLHTNMVLLLSRQNQPQEAFAHLEGGLQQLPASSELYETAAALAQHWGETELAERYLRRGLTSEGTDRARLLNNLGVHYGEIGRSGEALEALRESLQIDPGNPVTLRNLGKEYYARQQWPEAMAALRNSLQLEPGHPEALEGLGMAALQAGDAASARWAAAKLKHGDSLAAKRLESEIALRVRPRAR
ncbi:MAG: tetratricopeptide repeat protein [Deltaproteobacteria bacterium]|nr:MAG: tetratricopeptide repeat protein [Deltaproteobacteria bacterium]